MPDPLPSTSPASPPPVRHRQAERYLQCVLKAETRLDEEAWFTARKRCLATRRPKADRLLHQIHAATSYRVANTPRRFHDHPQPRIDGFLQCLTAVQRLERQIALPTALTHRARQQCAAWLQPAVTTAALRRFVDRQVAWRDRAGRKGRSPHLGLHVCLYQATQTFPPKAPGPATRALLAFEAAAAQCVKIHMD